MKQSYQELLSGTFSHRTSARNFLKRIASRLNYGKSRLLILACLAVAGTSFAVAKLASREAGRTRVNQSGATRGTVPPDRKPLSPLAPAITATLDDNVTSGNKVAPGGTINYTAVITNSAGVGNDATGVAYNNTIDANTTLVAGSIHASPVAFNDSYN